MHLYMTKMSSYYIITLSSLCWLSPSGMDREECVRGFSGRLCCRPWTRFIRVSDTFRAHKDNTFLLLYYQMKAISCFIFFFLCLNFLMTLCMCACLSVRLCFLLLWCIIWTKMRVRGESPSIYCLLWLKTSSTKQTQPNQLESRERGHYWILYAELFQHTEIFTLLQTAVTEANN